MHKGVIDDLQEVIEAHETRIANQTKSGTDAIDSAMAKKHIEFRNSIESQRQIYADLKKDFFKFLSKYM